MIEQFFERKDRHNRVIDMTPELSTAFLESCNTHNRRLVQNHVDRLAHEMKAGRWLLTHQGIAFSENRVLLDGQHRLWAILMADVTVPMRAFFNESAEALTAIDAVRPRSNDEIISLFGGMGPVTKSELSTLRAMVGGLGNYDRLTPPEEAVILRRHREAVQFAHDLLPTARFRGVATAVTRGVLGRAFYSVSHAKLQHFADVLQSGVATCEEDQPITMLLKHLIESSHGRRGRPEVREHYGKTERALLAYLTGEQLSKLFASTAELFLLPEEHPQSSVA